MHLLAMLLALGLERALTHLLHLREPRWLDGYFGLFRGLLGRRNAAVATAGAVVAVGLPVLPVALLVAWLARAPFGLVQFALAVVVLLLSFGPRDLADEVDDYALAVERGDRAEADRRATELLEADARGRRAGLREAVEEAIFVQANNRIFGVIFWFFALAPAGLGAVGAWTYRVSDLLRRRAAFEAARDAAPALDDPLVRVLGAIHGLLAWLPARLAALGYALAGSFEDGVGHWRAAADGASERLLDRTEDLLARVGRGALQPSLGGVPAGDLEAATARGAWRIVSRALVIWLVAVAMLTLAGSAT